MAAALAAAHCSGPASPSPSSIPAPRSTRQSAATLTISSFEVNAAGSSSGAYYYRPTMVLVETSGKSAATLQSIAFTSPAGNLVVAANYPAGQGCFLTSQSRTVPAGQSWDITSVYYYCLDIGPFNLEGAQVRVTVNFADDQGRPGTVTGTTTVRQ